MQVIGYSRVSTEEQARDGVSLDAQAEKIRAYAMVKDWTLAELSQDAGHSAKSLKRPGLAGLLAMVEARHVDVVIVYKLDRLTRSVKDLSTLVELFEKKGVATGQPVGKPQRHDSDKPVDDESVGECESVGAVSHRGAHPRCLAALESARTALLLCTLRRAPPGRGCAALDVPAPRGRRQLRGDRHAPKYGRHSRHAGRSVVCQCCQKNPPADRAYA